MKNPSQQQMQGLAHVAARVLIASFFIARALGLIVDPSSMQQFLVDSLIPEQLRWPNAAFEILAALAIMFGYQTRTAAALLALYVFWTSFILNYLPGDPYALGAFWRDLSMIGGLLLIYSHGRGRYALDNYFLGAEGQDAETNTTSDNSEQHQPLEAGTTT